MDSYVYMVECADGTLYTGWTTKPLERVKTHNSGKGAKYTRGRGPVLLVYLEPLEDKSAGLIRERQIKKLATAEKRALILEHAERSAALKLALEQAKPAKKKKAAAQKPESE